MIGLFKTELIKPGGPSRTLEQVEIATLDCVDWFNHQCLLEALSIFAENRQVDPATVYREWPVQQPIV
jgi:hypothetical protein